jgi:predicted metal-binding membrane protein
MADLRTGPFTVQRSAILGLLLALAAAAWVLLFAWHGSDPGTDMAMASPTMGLRAPLFLAIWVTMMVAMMFPAAAPMVLTFHRVQAGRRERGGAFVPTWVFVAGYMLVWTLAGAAAYLAASAAEAVAASAELSPEAAARIGGAVLVAAGLYQLSPLKDLCLSKCRTPVGFIMTSWREGTMGALRMGLLHGAYCLGCCWLLFAIPFPLGLMNIAAMAVLTALVFAEKTLPWGQRAARGTAAVLIAYGVVVVGFPRALPTFSVGDGMVPAGAEDSHAGGHAGARRRGAVLAALTSGTVQAANKHLQCRPTNPLCGGQSLRKGEAECRT